MSAIRLVQVIIPGCLRPIQAVQMPDGWIGAVLRSLCAALSLDYASQYQRFRRTLALREALRLVTLETPGGPQAVDVVPAWAIPVWLAGIHISRLPEEKRASILAFQREAVAAIEHAFAQPGNAAAQPLPAQSTTPQSVWQEGHAFLDHLQDYLEAKDEAVRHEFHTEGQAIRREFHIEHQEVRNHLAEVEQKLRRELLPRQQQAAHPLRSAALEAGEVRSTMGSFAERLVQINLLALRARQKYGYPIAMTLAGLAEHFQVADVFDLPDKDWPAVLEWFTALLED